MKHKALVTGGAGFIGSNLCSSLLNKDYQVVVFDNLSRKGSKDNLLWLTKNFPPAQLSVETGDIRNYQKLKKAISKVEVVFHLASQVAVTTSFKNPRDDFEINALGSLNVLEAAREAGHRPIVCYASSNKVYGAMEKVSQANYPNGIDEDYPLDFHSPYSCSKGVADQYTRDYYRLYKIPTVVFRQSCIYGPRQMGIEDQGWVAYFVISILTGKPITIYGDGRQVRDLLYIDDLISAYMQAIEKIKKTQGQIYNIGGGKKNAVSLLGFIDLLKKKTGKKVSVKFSSSRPGDQQVFITDTARLKKELGWSPKVTYEKGIEKLLEWLKESRFVGK